MLTCTSLAYIRLELRFQDELESIFPIVTDNLDRRREIVTLGFRIAPVIRRLHFNQRIIFENKLKEQSHEFFGIL